MHLTEENLLLPVTKVSDLAEPVEKPIWLIQHLWLNEGAGIIGGPAKGYKTWYGLEMCVAIASGMPCLKRFPVLDPGPVLVYLAEDALPQLRKRVEGLCRYHGIEISSLMMHVITSPALRLDQEADQKALMNTVALLKPKVILLDPLVRMHSLSENDSRDMAWLLGFLRELQRAHGTAVMLTHHASKRSHSRPGQALRGSGDLYAFVDCLAYLARDGDHSTLTLEHRSAAAIEPLTLVLKSDNDSAHLEVAAMTPKKTGDDLSDQVLAFLGQRPWAETREKIREALKVKNERLGRTLYKLKNEGILRHDDDGWSILP